MSVLRQEQTKLSELIPLSAAESGMVIGTRQLDNLRSHLETCIHDSFRNASITGNNNDEVEFSNTSNKFDLFTWKGKMRSVPMSFELIRIRSKPIDIWRKWWIGSYDNSKRIRPYRILLNRHKNDIVEAYKARGQSTSSLSKTMCEMRAVMSFFECQARKSSPEIHQRLTSLEERKINDPVQLEEYVSEVWRAAWSTGLPQLQSISTCRRTVTTSKRRKHDLSRCGIRALYERVRRLPANARR